MSFWDIFSNTNSTDAVKKHSSLHYEVKEMFPNLSEEELIKTTCLAGLFARVAYVDFSLEKSEITHMKKALKEMTDFNDEEIANIVTLANKHIKELAGLENHKFVYSLKEVMDQGERYKIVEALFYIAASDGTVANDESEEIRIINKGFDLSDRHFAAARAKVSDKLGALRG
jgi:uncharacterized tellurite resistance protein B-like protein